jgi:hypothetical protein
MQGLTGSKHRTLERFLPLWDVGVIGITPENALLMTMWWVYVRDRAGMPFGFPPERAFSFAGIPHLGE